MLLEYELSFRQWRAGDSRTLLVVPKVDARLLCFFWLQSVKRWDLSPQSLPGTHRQGQRCAECLVVVSSAPTHATQTARMIIVSKPLICPSLYSLVVF